MTRVLLQDMVEDVELDALPANWRVFDAATFSRKKRLWDYQVRAVENAVKVLWKYYQDLEDYRPGEALVVNLDRKRRLLEWYEDNGLGEDLDIPLSKANRSVSRLLVDYYQTQDGKVPYQHFINRACFWMATGSGKTLVIVKLIEVLRDLIQLGQIPPNDVLVLTHRDDLIEQLKAHVNEFNAARSDLFIRLRELREYEAAKRESPSLFKEHELTVLYYRSDNLSDEQKEKIIDFRNYDDDGKWYILLDEAHKGDKEDSKRQHIYSILSRNGFLFSFSATFTDKRDLVTTAANFNLAQFIQAGYGKHISILKQEMRAFRDDEDYNNEEKQKVVLKSLMLLACVRKSYEAVQHVRSDLYHSPLLLTLVNSVNTQDADLKLFFRELERIGKGEVPDTVWQQAKDELWRDLEPGADLMFEAAQARVDQQTFQSLSRRDVLERVYNAGSSGEIEVLVRPSDRHELALKLKTGDTPFALIKIGDISGWLKKDLSGYEVNERFEDESCFKRLNDDDSPITILMGSRSFYEGWDSNRPNVINFINIGIGADARKFILQSIGRGVRIEPLKSKRKRLLPLYNAKEIEAPLFQRIKDQVLPMETLFIFGTNRSALQTVMEQLDREKGEERWQQLSLFVNEDARERKLLIPVYRRADRPLIEQRQLTRFVITPEELELVKRYVGYIGDDRVLLALYEGEPKKVEILRRSLGKPDDCYRTGDRSYRNVDLLVRRILEYFGVIPEELDRLKPLADEIAHFKAVTVSLKDIGPLQGKVDKVRDYPTRLRELRAQYGKIPPDEYGRKWRETCDVERFEVDGKGKIEVKYVANHYYVPVILPEHEKVNYIKHIIRTPSEVQFVRDLEQYVRQDGNRFRCFDWWLFSKLDESVDEVHVPYYDGDANAIRRFKPDFIFWLQKADDYFILFIDPKGTEHTGYERKIDGYSVLFEEGGNGKRVLYHEGLKVTVHAFLYTDDVNRLPERYRAYWFHSVDKMVAALQ